MHLITPVYPQLAFNIFIDQKITPLTHILMMKYKFIIVIKIHVSLVIVLPKLSYSFLIYKLGEYI